MSLPRQLKLSKGSLLLLHLVALGHVWRDAKGFWVASTDHTKRNVHLRISNMIRQGVVTATYRDQFPRLTEDGLAYLRENPLRDVLAAKRIH